MEDRQARQAYMVGIQARQSNLKTWQAYMIGIQARQSNLNTWLQGRHTGKAGCHLEHEPEHVVVPSAGEAKVIPTPDCVVLDDHANPLEYIYIHTRERESERERERERESRMVCVRSRICVYVCMPHGVFDILAGAVQSRTASATPAL